MKGIYALLIKVKRKVNIQIGKLGKFEFPKGWYLYIGSGKNGLEKRVKRHLRKKRNLFWHIDYLLSAPDTEIEKVWIKEGGKECSLAKRIAQTDIFKIPVPGFGSSDCRCKSHLFLICQKGKEINLLRENKLFLLDLNKEFDKFFKK